MTDAAIRIGVIALLVVWCLKYLLPFLAPLIWGVILAVALEPLHKRVTAALGGRQKLAAATISLSGLALLLVPSVLVAGSLFEGAEQLADGIEQHTLHIPPPPEQIARIPLVGQRLDGLWEQAHADLEGTMAAYAPSLASAAGNVMGIAADVVSDITTFCISVLIAGALMATAAGGTLLARRVGRRLGGERGVELVDLSTATIRSVAKGLLGIAAIQAVAAWIGMAVAGVPGAPVWALLVLMLAIMQLPPLLVLVPVAVYVFNTASTATAVLFLVWAVVVGVSDTLLKPLLLGRGVDVPMVVFLVGAIGGLVSSGLVGLFVGAVVLAVGYKVFMAWLEAGERQLDPSA